MFNFSWNSSCDSDEFKLLLAQFSPEKNENKNTEKNKNDLEIAGLPCSSTSVKSADLFDLTCAIEKEAFKRQEENEEVILEPGIRPKSKKTFGIKRTKSHEMELQPTPSENNLEIDIFPCSSTSVKSADLFDLTCAIKKEAFKRQEENKEVILESGTRPKTKKTLRLKRTKSREMELQPTRSKNNLEIAGLPCSSTSVKSAVLVDNTIEKEAYKRQKENEEVILESGTRPKTKKILRLKRTKSREMELQLTHSKNNLEIAGLPCSSTSVKSADLFDLTCAIEKEAFKRQEENKEVILEPGTRPKSKKTFGIKRTKSRKMELQPTRSKNNLEIAGSPCSSTSVKTADIFDLTCAIEKEAFKRQEGNKEVILKPGTRPKTKRTLRLKRTKSRKMELQPTRSKNNLEIAGSPCSSTSVKTADIFDLTCAIEKKAFKRQEENKEVILKPGTRPKSKKTFGIKRTKSRKMELQPTHSKNNLEIAGSPCSSTSVKTADIFDLTCAIEKKAFKRQEENKEVILKPGTRPKTKKTLRLKRTKSREMELQPTRSKNNLEIAGLPCSSTSVKSAVLVDNTIEKEAYKRQEENEEVILESGTRPKSKKTLGLKLSMSRRMELRPTHIINYLEIGGLPCSSTSVKSAVLVDNTIEKEAYPREENEEVNSVPSTFELTEPNKRKIFDKYFNDRSQRKFPGPAGLLIDAGEIADDENMCQIELLSQDVEYIESRLPNAIFSSPIWTGLQSHIQHWKLDIDSIETIKKQALSGTLKGWKAQNVIAVIEAINRSSLDPFITLRDTTDSIKCTLHRDAWLAFSQYLVSECCALVIQKPSVLTLGHATKNHYLNITMDNILAIYSKKVRNKDSNRTLPKGYIMYEDVYTMITTECR